MLQADGWKSERFGCLPDTNYTFVKILTNIEKYNAIIGAFKLARELGSLDEYKDTMIQIPAELFDNVKYMLQLDGWKVSFKKDTCQRVNIKINWNDPNDNQDMFRVIMLNKKFQEFKKKYGIRDPAYKVEKYVGVRGGFKDFGFSDEKLVQIAIEKYGKK